MLPWGGDDPMEQPAFVVEALRICELEHHAAEARAAEKQLEQIKTTGGR